MAADARRCEALLELALRDRRDDLAHQIAHQVSGRDDFLTILIDAITISGRSDSDALALIAQMIAIGDLTQQDAVDRLRRLAGGVGLARLGA